MDAQDYQWYSEWSVRIYAELLAIAFIYLLGIFIFCRKQTWRRALIRAGVLSGFVSLLWFGIAFLEHISSGGNPGWKVAEVMKEQLHFKIVTLPIELGRSDFALMVSRSGAQCLVLLLSLFILTAAFFILSIPILLLLVEPPPRREVSEQQ